MEWYRRIGTGCFSSIPCSSTTAVVAAHRIIVSDIKRLRDIVFVGVYARTRRVGNSETGRPSEHHTQAPRAATKTDPTFSWKIRTRMVPDRFRSRAFGHFCFRSHYCGQNGVAAGRFLSPAAADAAGIAGLALIHETLSPIRTSHNDVCIIPLGTKYWVALRIHEYYYYCGQRSFADVGQIMDFSPHHLQ